MRTIEVRRHAVSQFYKYEGMKSSIYENTSLNGATHACVLALETQPSDKMLHVEQTKPDFPDDLPAALPIARRRAHVEVPDATSLSIKMLHVEHLSPNPNQPRRDFDEDSLALLAASIKKHGLLQPITVRVATHQSEELSPRYQIIAGERRWRATQQLGEKEIAARIVEADDLFSATLALIENTQRTNLNILELANAYENMINKYGWTQQQLSDHVASTRQQVGHVLGVLKLPDGARKYLLQGELSLGHAKVLLSLQHPYEIERAATIIVENSLSVRAAHELVLEMKNLPAEDVKSSKSKKRESSAATRWTEWQEKWENLLETSVKIEGRKGNYHLKVRFSDAEDLERLFQSLAEKEKLL